MAVVVYSSRALTEIERLADFLLEQDPQAAVYTVSILMDAIAMLAQNPLVGRIVEQGLRELVISRGRSGYVALYRYDAGTDQVFILALRHQRELG
ncbi:MAG: type II toxin-antitoxin system RelE/ParE family toxin [Betaproteobacteria bacterium]